jgi:hypothetical protein
MTADADPTLGQRPHSNKVPCMDCGHVWFEGERRHHYVDDAGKETIESGARVLCTLCMQQRDHPRDDEERFDWGTF